MSRSKGIILSIKVIPLSQKVSVEAGKNTDLLVRVRQAPERGKANRELIAVLAELFGLRKREVQVLSGAASRFKRVLLPRTEEVIRIFSRFVSL